jgi:hypothetical protein
VGDAEGRVHIFDLKESSVAAVLVVPTNTERLPVKYIISYHYHIIYSTISLTSHSISCFHVYLYVSVCVCYVV